MFRRNLNGLIDVSAVEEIEAPNPFLRFGEGAFGDQELALRTRTVLALSIWARRWPMIRLPFLSWLEAHSSVLSRATWKEPLDEVRNRC